MEAYVGAGSSNATEKERALVMLKNLELDEETARAGPKTEKEEKVLLQLNPAPLEFPFPLPLGPGEEEEGGEPGWSKAAGAGKKRRRRRRRKTFRIGMEYIDFVAGYPLPRLYQPVHSFDLGFLELQESFVAQQIAEREERDNILRQFEEFGYADLEIEVPDSDEDEIHRESSRDYM